MTPHPAPGRGDLRDRVRLPAPAPRGLGTGQVAAILVSLPRTGRQGGGLGPRRRGRRRSGVPGEVAAVMRDGRPVRGVATDHEGGCGRWPLRHQPRGEGSGVQGDGQQSWPHPAPRLRVAGTPSLI